MTDVRLTPTQRKIMDVLGDGRPHEKDELLRCLPDDLTTVATLQVHIHNIRQRLDGTGHDIVCQVVHRKGLYRLVRLISRDE